MAGVRWRGGAITLMTVTDENEIAKGTRLVLEASGRELAELTFWRAEEAGTGEWGGEGLDERVAGREKVIARRSSASLP
jgi:hypothetical protein